MASLAGADEPDRPNILFILLDDMGKEWVSAYGSQSVKTQSIDEMANSGMRFENAYVHPQCTPTRMSFLTGQYPYRNGWVDHWMTPFWGHAYYDWQSSPSIARIMRSAGYATAAAGKWGLNDFRVQSDAMENHGFDEYMMWTGLEGGNVLFKERYWNPYIHTKNGSKTYQDSFGEDLFSDFLLDFIETKRKEGKPWFAYYAMNLPHPPYVTTPSESDLHSKQEKFAAMVRYADFLVGKMLEGLRKSGQINNTIVVLAADNGSPRPIEGIRNGKKVRGGKGTTTESGVNTPFIVYSPQLVPQGVVSTALVDITDLLPSFAELAGAKLPGGVQFDGKSFVQHILGNSADSKREWIMAMGGGDAKLSEAGVENSWQFRDRVIRDKRLKLYVNATNNTDYEKLIDLENDPLENLDVTSSKNPEIQQAFKKLMEAAKTMPAVDNDPIYQRLPANSWDASVSVKSQQWKK